MRRSNVVPERADPTRKVYGFTLAVKGMVRATMPRRRPWRPPAPPAKVWRRRSAFAVGCEEDADGLVRVAVQLSCVEIGCRSEHGPIERDRKHHPVEQLRSEPRIGHTEESAVGQALEL